jgi:hypothetical protein
MLLFYTIAHCMPIGNWLSTCREIPEKEIILRDCGRCTLCCRLAACLSLARFFTSRRGTNFKKQAGDTVDKQCVGIADRLRD